jgi:hypothetical protein
LSLSLKTHEVTVNKATGEAVGTRVTPYIRLCSGDGPPIFLQGGGYFYEGGEEVPEDQHPDWLEGMQKKCSPDALKACGFK